MTLAGQEVSQRGQRWALRSGVKSAEHRVVLKLIGVDQKRVDRDSVCGCKGQADEAKEGKKKNVQKNKNQKKRLAMQVREVEILNVHFNKVKCRRRGQKHHHIHNIQNQNNTEWTETQYKKNSSWTGNKSIPKSVLHILKTQ